MKYLVLSLELAILCPGMSRADVSDSGNLTINGQGVIVGTLTVRGNAFSVGGSTFVVSGGNVGIGITSPTEPLDIKALNMDGYNAIQMSTGTFASGAVVNQFEIQITAGGRGYIGTLSNHPFYIITNGSNRLYIDASGNVGINTNTPSHALELGTGDAQKPTGTAWLNPSDSRLKKDITPFTDGLNVINQITPVRYKLNGMAGLPKDMPGIGVVAEEIQKIAPYAVRTWRARMGPPAKGEKWENYLRREKEIDLLSFDGSPLTFILINAIKEQQKEIEELRAEVGALKK